MKYIKKFIDYYQKQDGIIFWSVSFSTLMSLFLVTLFLTYYFILPTQIPLFYSLPWGDSQLSQKNQFIILPSLILLIMFINLIISWHLHASQLHVKRLIAISTLAISFVVVISGIKIIFTVI